MIRSIACICLLASSQVAIANGFFTTGSNLHQWYQAYQRISADNGTPADYSSASGLTGYVTGVADASNDLCMASNVNGGQTVAVVGVYLEAHPEEWNQGGAVIVRRALLKAFPCK